ncbi:MAG: phosphatase PAP2 family protein [Duncaniella sp.]|nr:phosphatase PAP2 family protein [Duncaniella sp.]
MLKSSYLPPLREAVTITVCLAVWLAVTAIFVGFRTEHLYIAVFLAAMLFATGYTRRLIVALMPFIIFGISYDWMNILPNYMVNSVDIRGLYDTERSLFGITVAPDVTLTPNEWWALHTAPVLDFMAGCFYLCWVPVPVLFGVWLYLNGQYKVYLHFSIVFLLVNLIGFAGYYIHPAAPPWYVAMHGFDFIPGTHGETAGLGAWDSMTGLGIFNGLYARNSNVFAAMPSLHAAYMLIAFIYSLRARCSVALRVLFAFICLGIWWTAVYTSHHYILDVSAGIGVTLLGWGLFELVLMKLPPFKRFIDKYKTYISA